MGEGKLRPELHTMQKYLTTTVLVVEQKARRLININLSITSSTNYARLIISWLGLYVTGFITSVLPTATYITYLYNIFIFSIQQNHSHPLGLMDMLSCFQKSFHQNMILMFSEGLQVCNHHFKLF